jgi:hypothetical protein
MRPVLASALIDVPRARVFDLLCDLSVRPSFTDHFLVDFRLERLDPVGVGAAARFRIRESGRWLDTVIEEAERPHLIRERGSGGRLNRVPAFTVWELSEGVSHHSCEVSVAFWTEPQNAFDKLRELGGSSRHFRRDWKRALIRLREIAETGGPLQRVEVAGAALAPAFSA